MVTPAVPLSLGSSVDCCAELTTCRLVVHNPQINRKKMFKQHRFVGLLNKLTEANFSVLRKEFLDLKFEPGDEQRCADFVVLKSCNEPQFSHLFAALVKGTVVSAQLKGLEVHLAGDCSSERERQMTLGTLRFLCNLRHHGVLTNAHFNGQLRGLLSCKSELFVDSVFVIKDFREIVPVETWKSLLDQCDAISAATASMRVKFVVDDVRSSESEKETPKKKVDHRLEQRVSSRCTVYFSNVDCSITESKFAALLVSFGGLEKVRLCGNPRNATVFAFVEFENEESAKRAVASDGRILLGGFALRASFSKSVIQDKSSKDATYGKWGRIRTCLFGFSQDSANHSLRKLMS